MKRLLLIACTFALFCVPVTVAQKGFTLEQIIGVPFAENLIAAKSGTHIAWTVNQSGKRNIWVAEGPDFRARQLTAYAEDDGGELSDLHFTADGNAIVYVRGEGKNVSGEYANPTSKPEGMQETVWQIAFGGGTPKKVDEGHSPRISAQGKVAYARGGQIWVVALQGEEKPKQIVVRGKNEPLDWSIDGGRLLFVSDRGDHSFVGICDLATDSVKFLAPSVDSDSDAVWSMDGKRVAFVRQPAVPRDTPEGFFIQPDRPHPWAIWVADAQTGEAREVWKSSSAAEGSYPYMAGQTGGGVLNWAADNMLVFAGEQDGWQHLYATGADGGAAKLLTPGNCEVEEWSFSPDRKTILLNSNCGDIDRRHLWRVGINGEKLEQVTKGDGIEWAPVILGDGQKFAYLGSSVRNPGAVFTAANAGNGAKPEQVAVSGSESHAENWGSQLVAPQPVLYKAADGLEIHAQLFLPKDVKPGEKRPALIFLHGGPVRQMLLGWHYMYYYANSYAMNQYLASRGYIVLAINYRSGIGYGRIFREAPGRAGRGATEYQDVVAAGKYLQGRNDVDAKRIGLWGGSYGGYLTALGLARNSDMFAAGVDFHGVHDWPTDNWNGKNISPDLIKLAHTSSPVTSVDTWKSPVLLIHGDDDRNVFFSQTVDLVARLRERGVSIEQLVFPDEVHDFLLHRNWLKAYQATSDFFDRQFGAAAK
ncbi:MAG TPA: prolyl oligopeptidase family serine peptidase [Candidatus Acidoferrum sp.]